RVTGPGPPPVQRALVFDRPAEAAASAPSPGTLSLLAAVGNPPATELRLEAPSGTGSKRVFEFRYRGNPIRRPISIDATGKVTVHKLKVMGKLVFRTPPAPAGGSAQDPTGSVAAAEVLRQQLTQGLGIGKDIGIAIAIA